MTDTTRTTMHDTTRPDTTSPDTTSRDTTCSDTGGSATPVAIDRASARAHLALLAAPGTAHIFCAIPEAPGTRAPIRHLVGPLDALAGTLDRLNRQGCGIFVTVNAMSGRRRRNADVAAIRALWAERDGPGPALPLAASLVIATSPGRCHEYLLTDPADPLDPAVARRLNRALARRCHADTQASDNARALRLAGSWHLKGEPFQVAITGGSGARYATATLIAALAPPALARDVTPSAHSAHPGPDHAFACCPPADAAARARLFATIARRLAAARPGTRNAALNAAAYRLGRLGVSFADTEALLVPVALLLGLGATETAATLRSGHGAGLALPSA